MTDYDVIICGLGPVGQLLALLLGDQGVATLAFDREPEPYPLPRAAVIDDEVLRILQAVGARSRCSVRVRAASVTRRSSPSTSRPWSARCSTPWRCGRASRCAAG